MEVKKGELGDLGLSPKVKKGVPDDGAPAGVERWPDNGEPVVVLRPLDLPVTLALAKTALAHNNGEALEQAVGGGPCRLLGFLVKRTDGSMVAVDENGENPEDIGPGDILAAPSNLRKGD